MSLSGAGRQLCTSKSSRSMVYLMLMLIHVDLGQSQGTFNSLCPSLSVYPACGWPTPYTETFKCTHVNRRLTACVIPAS